MAYGVLRLRCCRFGFSDNRLSPAEMIKFGIGSIVHNSEELNNWFKELKTNNIKLEQIRNTALEYAKASSGATKNIINELTKI